VKYLVHPDCKIDPNLKHWISKEGQFFITGRAWFGLKKWHACPTKQKTEVS